MLLRFFIILSATLHFPLARCQDSSVFTVPKVWRNPTSNKTVDESIKLVDAVVDTFSFNATTGQVDALGFEQSANLVSAISLADYRAGTTTHKDLVMTNFNKAMALAGSNIDGTLNSVVIVWGLAAVDAYRAYKDPAALTVATTAWDRATQYFVTPDDVTRGIHPLKNNSIAQSCYNGTTAGGVFYLISNNLNTDVNGETVAAYLALSALLAEETSGAQYLTNAELSAQFIRDNLYNGTFVEDTITINNCARTTFALSYNSGYFLLGLSVLASKNESWVPFLHSLIASTVPFSVWTSAAGVDIEGQSAPNDALTNSFTQALKGIYIRGLYEAWNRTTSAPDVANYVKSWITVQYNALQDLASLPDSNQYSPMWQGPAFEQSLPWGQLSALDVLGARVGFAHNETTTSTPTSSSALPGATTGSDNAGNSTSKPDIGAIVGGVIGGIALIIACILAWFLVRRRRRLREQAYEQALIDATPSPYQTPYSANQTAPYDPPYGGGHHPGQHSMSQFSGSQLYLPSAASGTSHPTDTSRSNFSQTNLTHSNGTQPSSVPSNGTRSNFSSSTDPLSSVSQSTGPQRQLAFPPGVQPSFAQAMAPNEKSSAHVLLEYQPSSSNRTRTVSTAGPSPPTHAPGASLSGMSSTTGGGSLDANAARSERDDRTTLDLAAVPDLINQLNRIMARLPVGGVEDEAPPRYGES